ncbi:hypothetical protein HPP92_011526 [Vanilla planifolia]|uniref:Uncharacterized protein n=1 Tax=Vanilla planifolia TaxID=51239 RepID=A0A835V2W6_VANPL|nr:hypothetical protein HPP92_011526 [Vanilla planifolia]
MAPSWSKPKVVFVLGSTATGKSKLAISLALRFGGEVINSDKMQLYRGLDVITNKVTTDECAGIPHHLLGILHPDADFTAEDFRREATQAIDQVLSCGCLPIVAGGSNNYIKELIQGNNGEFPARHDCCFLWVDVDKPVLDAFVAERLERMLEKGLVVEAWEAFDASNADYSKGIRRSIGLPEMDRFFRSQEKEERLLAEAIEEIRSNTCKLAEAQREKIVRLVMENKWSVWKVDATAAIVWRGEKEAERVWGETVLDPSVDIVKQFLEGEREVLMTETASTGCGVACKAAAMATVLVAK